ncbi:MAG: SufD family Fe-S cluster assembly protein [Fibrobacteraceae bacterium]|nr:SufD family Fe-S cluster assembly protein [Fibrobacteraceae bacterium]
MQKQALTRIRELGFPTRKSEDWHFYPVSKLAQISALNALKDTPVSSDSDKLNEADFGIADETDFSALLPIALGAKVFLKDIPEGSIEKGILKPRDEFSHTVFYLGKNAKASLEILENKTLRALSAERLDFFLSEGAELELYSTEEEHAGEVKFRSIRIHQAMGSTVSLLDLNRTDSLCRTSTEIFLNGEKANAGYRALCLVNNTSEVHGFVRIHHNAPHCKSRQFVRNLISGSAYVSYDGEVFVGKNCTGTDSSELVNTMLLSDNAKVSVKPILKIYHDDVECTHGNTCGSLDEESVFYLLSRGLNKKSAEQLLIRAFAEEVLSEHPYQAGQERLRKILQKLI